jgi:hypothetical protein
MLSFGIAEQLIIGKPGRRGSSTRDAISLKLSNYSNKFCNTTHGVNQIHESALGYVSGLWIIKARPRQLGSAALN